MVELGLGFMVCWLTVGPVEDRLNIQTIFVSDVPLNEVEKLLQMVMLFFLLKMSLCLCLGEEILGIYFFIYKTWSSISEGFLSFFLY